MRAGAGCRGKMKRSLDAAEAGAGGLRSPRPRAHSPAPAAKAARLRLDAPGPLGVHIRGPLPSDCFKVRILEGSREYSEEVVRRAAACWESQVREQPHLFDGPVWCLRSVVEGRGPHAEDDVGGGAAVAGVNGGERPLTLEIQRSSFSYTYYTHFTEEGHRLPPAERTGSIGVSAITQTADGYAVFGKRSERSNILPGRWHMVPAGHLDCADPVAGLVKELHEELACTTEDVQRSNFIALATSGAEQGDKFEATWWFWLSVTAEELHRRFHRAEDQVEHDTLIFVKLPAVEGEAPAASEPSGTSFQTASFEAFLGDGYTLTDSTHRMLRLFQEMRAAGDL